MAEKRPITPDMIREIVPGKKWEVMSQRAFEWPHTVRFDGERYTCNCKWGLMHPFGKLCAHAQAVSDLFAPKVTVTVSVDTSEAEKQLRDLTELFTDIEDTLPAPPPVAVYSSVEVECDSELARLYR